MAALIAGPALAQEASPETTSAVPQAQLPEISGDALANESPSSDLNRLSAHSISAQQFGNLAATKGTSSLIGDLGDVMVLLHSQVNERLHEGDGEGQAEIDEADRKRLNELSQLNGAEFNVGLAQWMKAEYPEAIDAWRNARSMAALSPLAEAVIPQLEAQLMVADKVLKADGELTSPDQQVRQTLSWGGGEEEGKVAEQFRIEGENPAPAEGE